MPRDALLRDFRELDVSRFQRCYAPSCLMIFHDADATGRASSLLRFAAITCEPQDDFMPLAVFRCRDIPPSFTMPPIVLLCFFASARCRRRAADDATSAPRRHGDAAVFSRSSARCRQRRRRASADAPPDADTHSQPPADATPMPLMLLSARADAATRRRDAARCRRLPFDAAAGRRAKECRCRWPRCAAPP